MKRKQSKYSEHFERIETSPEALAKKIMNTPPKKKDEWQYKKAQS